MLPTDRWTDRWKEGKNRQYSEVISHLWSRGGICRCTEGGTMADLLWCMWLHSSSCLVLSSRHCPHIDKTLRSILEYKHTAGKQKDIQVISSKLISRYRQNIIRQRTIHQSQWMFFNVFALTQQQNKPWLWGLSYWLPVFVVFPVYESDPFLPLLNKTDTNLHSLSDLAIKNPKLSLVPQNYKMKGLLY